MKRLTIGKYLVADPKVCHGKLAFTGTRVPVRTVLTFLSMGDSIDDILRNWPELSREAVEETIGWAADLVQEKQFKTSALLRQLFRLPEFKTKTARMGKIARISSARIEYMEVSDENVYTLNWPISLRKR